MQQDLQVPFADILVQITVARSAAAEFRLRSEPKKLQAPQGVSSARGPQSARAPQSARGTQKRRQPAAAYQTAAVRTTAVPDWVPSPRRPASSASGKWKRPDSVSRMLDPGPRFLKPIQFQTWDQMRCGSPVRAWPPAPVGNSTLYDADRKAGEESWRCQSPIARMFQTRTDAPTPEIGSRPATRGGSAQPPHSARQNRPGTSPPWLDAGTMAAAARPAGSAAPSTTGYVSGRPEEEEGVH